MVSPTLRPPARSSRLEFCGVDATANVDRVNSAEKIATLIRNVKSAGFNTLVFDIKPISGHTMYPSQFAPKLQEWKGKVLPSDFDPLAAMVSECKKNALTLFVSLNAFSEGHRDFKIGPGYEKKDWQTILYEPLISAYSVYNDNFPVSPVMNTNGGKRGSDRRIRRSKRHSGQHQWRHLRDCAGQIWYRRGYLPSWQRFRGTGSSRRQRLDRQGCGIELLRNQAPVNSKIRFDSVPRFLPISERPEQQVPLMGQSQQPRGSELRRTDHEGGRLELRDRRG